jgi:hypothetical protein
MANLLHYSDYKRFIEELVNVRELSVIAELITDFVGAHVDGNPSFYDVFLDALLNVYPNYSLLCEEEFLFEFNEENYKDCPNPKLEFAGQYFHYLSSKSNEDTKGNRASRNVELAPYDIAEEPKYVIDQELVYGSNEHITRSDEKIEPDSADEKKGKPYTFGIRETFKPNIEKLLEEISEDIIISREERSAQKLAHILTCKDLDILSESDRSVRIVCKTNFFVLLLDEIRVAFGGTINARVMDRATIYTNTGKPLSIQNIYTSRSRNNDLTPSESEAIGEAIKRHSPKK